MPCPERVVDDDDVVMGILTGFKLVGTHTHCYPTPVLTLTVCLTSYVVVFSVADINPFLRVDDKGPSSPDAFHFLLFLSAATQVFFPVMQGTSCFGLTTVRFLHLSLCCASAKSCSVF